MMKITLITAAALCVFAQSAFSSPVPEARQPRFHLVPCVTKGPSKFNGGRITGFHTGATESAAVREPKGPKFFINGTSLQISGTPDLPLTIGLQKATPYNSTAPSDYLYVDLNEGFSKSFAIDKDGFIEYTGDKSFETFIVCHVNGIAPYINLGPQDELLWRGEGAKASYDKCADVKLKAAYVS